MKNATAMRLTVKELRQVCIAEQWRAQRFDMGVIRDTESVMRDVIKVRLKRKDERRSVKGNP